MAQFVVTITYLPINSPGPDDDLDHFDPPADRDDPYDKERVYKTLVRARSQREAFKKVLVSRREVEVEKRIYEDTVVGYSAFPFP